MVEQAGVAFVRAEGVLLGRGVMSAAAYFAANAAGFRERALRLGHLALTAPVYGVLGQSDRVLANRIAYLALRGMSEDRIAELSSEYFTNVVQKQLLEGGLDILRRMKRQQHKVVLVADSFEPVVRHLCDHIDLVDDYVCNRIEVRDGIVTGRLLDPVVGGHDLGRWAADYAQEHGFDLAKAMAYASHGPDTLLLATVAQPCAVNPDYTLRRAAREAHWPVVDYHV